MSEPRDIADQPDDPRTGSHYHPEFIHANPDRSIPWQMVTLVASAMVVAVFAVAAVFIAIPF